MAKHILICPECKKYTLKDVCTACKQKTSQTKPPKYSPEDKYAKFRRQVKEQEYQEKGLL
jgi:H/ACA ribonucleoprotein complex subunit 3